MGKSKSKITRISPVEDILSKLKSEGKVKPIDMKKIYEDREKQFKADEERYERETKAEKLRIEKLKCPCCKSIKKSPVCISHRDGPLVCGGRNHVSILAEYNVCQKCGTMYVDLNKKDVAPPMDRIRLLF